MTKGGSMYDKNLDEIGAPQSAELTTQACLPQATPAPSTSSSWGRNGFVQNQVVGISDHYPLDRAKNATHEWRVTPHWKRVLDLLFVLLALPIWLPLMLLIRAGIKMVSPGPVIYRQARVGQGGRVFMLYKFRSMKVNAETRSHEAYLEQLMKEQSPMTKLDAKGDPRLIPLGRLLRASGLDELPQIFNVLRGEMSLVGPRPCTIQEFRCYEIWQRERVSVLPGLTGYWQVNGKNKTTFNQMIEMDIHYARNASLLLDLKIMCKTIPVMIFLFLECWFRRQAKIERRELSPSTVTNIS